MPGDDLIFHGTTGNEASADGASEPDPANWLGGKRASQVLWEFESTLTTAQDDRSRHEIIDSSRIGDGEDVHALKWIAIQTGNNAFAAARVGAFDSTTGAFKLDRALGPGNAQIGDVYRVFEPNNVFAAVSPAEALAGSTTYRSIVIRNQHGNGVTNGRCWFVPLATDGYEIRLTQPGGNSIGGVAFLSRPDELTDPLNSLGNSDPGGGADNFGGCNSWRPLPLSDASAQNAAASWTNLTNIPLWLRRVIHPGQRSRSSVAVQIIVMTDLTGSDPDPLGSSAIIAWDVAIGSLEGELEPDRYVHRGGGTRFTARVQSAGIPVAEIPVQFAVRPGDLGSISADDDPAPDFGTTDSAGETGLTFISPELEAADGTVSRVQMLIPAGDEVGDPQPRVNLATLATFSFAVTADLTIPQDEREFLEDPGWGMEPSF